MAKTTQAKKTIDHQRIRRWIEDRGGRPVVVKKSQNGSGMLQIDFGKENGEFEPVSWKEFFRIFEENNLEFLYQDEIRGRQSRFFKFVDRS